MNSLDSAAQFILYGSGVYHLIGGITSIGPASWIRYFSEKTYKLDLPEKFSPEYHICVRAVGKFALFTSAISFYTAAFEDSKTKSAILLILAAMFLARAILRVAQRDLLLEAYKLEFKRSLYNVVFNVLLTMFTVYIALNV